ncbi:MAG: ATPase, partial [Lachnospiraceae bacterium]|nr:ATPase [Lachnospiraceae bacterium]
MLPKELIEQGKTALGIEFGSTRIKGVLIDYDGNVLAVGGHEWQNKLVDGIWTYDLADVDAGLQACYRDLCRDAAEKYGVTIKTLGAIGISAMMHGYIALDKD